MNDRKTDQPVQDGEQQVMASRARMLARASSGEVERKIVSRISVVSVGQERFGLPVDSLREIIRCPAVTALPGLPDWMPGVAKARESLVAVVDLGLWFGVVDTPAERQYMAVIQGPQGELGLCIEAVVGFQDLYEDEIAHFLQDRRRYEGLPIWATTHDLVTILDLGRLFENPVLRIGASSTTDQ